MTYKPLTRWPEISRNPADIRKLHKLHNTNDAAGTGTGADAPLIGLDLEWDERYGQPTILGVSNGEITVSCEYSEGRSHLINLLRLHPGTVLAGHNIVGADYFVLRDEGINIPLEQLEDTIIYHWLLNPHLCKATGKSALEEDADEKRGRGFMNLGTFSSIYTSLPYWKECAKEACGAGTPCPKHNVFLYNGADALAPVLALPAVKRLAKLRGVAHLYPLHRELAYVLAQMSRAGVLVDVPYVAKLREEFEQAKVQVAEELPFNPKSPAAVRAYFRERGITLKDAQEQTIRDAVEEFGDAAPEELVRLLEYKELGNGPDRWFAPRRWTGKEWKGFVDENGYIHAHIGPFTSSGRLQCSSPNLQNTAKRRIDRKTGENLGKKIRRAVIAPPGHYLIKGDFSNAENRVMLYHAGYDIPRDLDLHAWVMELMGLTEQDEFAIRMGGAREGAKSVQHSSNYGEGLSLLDPGSLGKERIRKEIARGARIVHPKWTFNRKIVTFTGINLAERAWGEATYENRRKALEIQERYFGRFPKLRELQQRITKQAELEKMVRPPHGYTLLSYGHDADRIKTALAVWGSQPVAHFTKLALVSLWRKYESGELPMRPILQIHDEILCVVPDTVPPLTAANWLRENMEITTPEMPGFSLPVDVAYSLPKDGTPSNWRDMTKVKW